MRVDETYAIYKQFARLNGETFIDFSQLSLLISELLLTCTLLYADYT